MKVAVVINSKIQNTKSILNELENELKKNDFEYKVMDIDNLIKTSFDFICAIGGDGTILKTARFYSDFEIPILGINLGRLGFLSQSRGENISKLVEIIRSKTYKIQSRTMLHSGKFVALNDFVLKGSCTRTSKFSLKINDKYVCDYIADGIIISTPTGSTAYGLSAGGPILCPNIDGLVIVPICPHTLTARPLVIPSNEKITISSMDEPLTVTIDGQEREEKVLEFEIQTLEKKAKLVFLTDDSFYSILRDKLHWGIAPTK